VSLHNVNVYDLAPATVGRFDVVVCGTLLLHLRDPLRALAAIRSVCDGVFLSTSQVDLTRSLLVRRRALARLDGVSELCQWWIPNAAGHRRLLEAGGFDVERESRIYAVPYGAAHPPRGRRPLALGAAIARRVACGHDGVPHHAALVRPAV
jgi:hypothetical protein